MQRIYIYPNLTHYDTRIWALIQYKDVVFPVEEIPLWDKTVERSTYHHNEISYSGKMASLNWIIPRALNLGRVAAILYRHISNIRRN